MSYSALSASAGLTDAARRAGTKPATNADPANTIDTAANVGASPGFTPNSNPRMKLTAASANRTLISRVRYETEYATTPYNPTTAMTSASAANAPTIHAVARCW